MSGAQTGGVLKLSAQLSIVGVLAALVLSLDAAAQAAAPQSSRKVLMTKDLADMAGKEALVYIVEYPPGTNNSPHRHNAHVFLHILEGQLNAQVRGGALTVLNPGDTYYESPDDIHVVSRNPSSSIKAKALIFMVHEKGAPLSTPVKD
jgi:quercetin dioxygenase-like cupin family protein